MDKLNIYTIKILLALIAFKGVYAQSFHFKNHTPIWHHWVKSGVFHDQIIIYGHGDPLIVGNDLYLTGILSKEFIDGHLLEKVDLATGDLRWRKVLFRENRMNREYPSLLYINEDSNVTMIVYAEKNTTKNQAWSAAIIGYRTYDPATGLVIDSSFADPNDSLAINLSILCGFFYPSACVIYPDMRRSTDTFYYYYKTVLGGYVSTSLYKLNKTGRVIDTSEFIYYISDETVSIKKLESKRISNGSFISLIYYERILYPERYKIVIEILRNMHTKPDTSFIDITEKVDKVANVKDYNLWYADTSRFVIRTKDRTENKLIYKLYCFDYKGNLLDTITLYTNKKDSLYYSISRPIFLRNNKMLFAVSKLQNNKSIIQLVQSDCNGNTEVLTTLEPIADSSYFKLNRIVDIDEERILFAIAHTRNYPNRKFNVWINWVMFSKDELFKKISTEKPNYRNKFTIYPNPVKTELFIKSSNQKIKEYIIYDVAGRLIKNEKYTGEKIDVIDLEPGVYMLHLKMRDDTAPRILEFIKN